MASFVFSVKMHRCFDLCCESQEGLSSPAVFPYSFDPLFSPSSSTRIASVAHVAQHQHEVPPPIISFHIPFGIGGSVQNRGAQSRSSPLFQRLFPQTLPNPVRSRLFLNIPTFIDYIISIYSFVFLSEAPAIRKSPHKILPRPQSFALAPPFFPSFSPHP